MTASAATALLPKSTVPTYSYRQLKGHSRVNERNSLIGEGILKENAILVIAGAQKSFKSFLTDAIALQLVAGRGHLFNAHRTDHGRTHPAFPVERECRVLVMEQEVGADDLEDRLNPMVASLPSDVQERINDNLFTHSFDYDLQLDSERGVQFMRQMVGDIQPNVLVFDPLCEFHTTNENDTQGMSKVMRAIDRLRQEFSPLACLINHHEGHQQQGKFTREGLDRLRGSTILGGKCDTGILLRVENRNALIVEVDTVLRRGKPIAPYRVRFDLNTMVPEFLSWGTKQSKKKAEEDYEKQVQVTQ